MNSEYDFSGNFFETKTGYKMHYLDEGPRSDDVPLLLLHGNPTWSFFYRKIIKCLSSEKRCIAPDHIGCGLSEKPNFRNFPYDLQTHSGNLIDLLDNLGVKKVIFLIESARSRFAKMCFPHQGEALFWKTCDRNVSHSIKTMRKASCSLHF